MHALRNITMCLISGLLLSHCAFLESAFELTFGEGDIPPLEQEFLWPTVGELTGLTTEEMQEIPGFPTALGDGTLAHLQGAMGLTGDCHLLHDQEEFEDPRVSKLTVSATNCTQSPNCAVHCVDVPHGVVFEATVEMKLIDEELAAEIQAQMAEVSEVSPEAIVQLRLQFSLLSLFQGEGEAAKDVTDLIDDFQFVMSDLEGNEVLVIKQLYLSQIFPEKVPAARFDVDSNSVFTKSLKEAVVKGEEFSARITVHFRVPQENLYEMQIEGGGVRMNMQPEVVISAFEVVKDQLN
jgi:hypothetical protein